MHNDLPMCAFSLNNLPFPLDDPLNQFTRDILSNWRDSDTLIWVIDRNLNVVCASDSVASFTGKPLLEIECKPDRQPIPSNAYSRINDLEDDVLATGTPVVQRLVRSPQQLMGPSGESVNSLPYWLITIVPWFNSGSDVLAPSGFIRLARDVTDAVYATASAYDEAWVDMVNEVSQGTFSSSLDKSAEPPTVEYTHNLEGTFVSMNDEGLKIFGFERSSLAQHSILEIVAERHKRHLTKSIKKQFRDLITRRPIIWRTKSATGSPVWLQIRAEHQFASGTELIHGSGWIVSLSSLQELNRHSRVIRGGRIAAWERELDSNRLTVSHEWKRLYGFDPEHTVTYRELLGRIHPDDRARVVKDFNDHKYGQKALFDSRFRIVKADGETRWIRSTAQIFLGMGGTSILSGYSIDIDSEMSDASALGDQDNLFQAIVDADPAMIYMKDEARRLVVANRSLCSFYQTTPEEAQGKKDDWFFRHNLHDPKVQSQLDLFKSCDLEVLSGKPGRARTVIEEIVPPGRTASEARWFSTVKIRVELGGRPFLVGISSDITRLYLDRELYKSLLELSPAAMFIKTFAGVYTDVNRRFAILLDQPNVESVEGKCASDFLSPASANETRESDQRCFEGTPDEYNRVLTLLDGNMKRVWGSKRAVRVLDSTGNFCQQLVGCDIDESETVERSRVEHLDSLLTSLKHDYVCSFLQIAQQEISSTVASFNDAAPISRDALSRWSKMIRFSLEFIERLQWLGRNPTFESVSQHSAYASNLSEIVEEAIELANMREEERLPECINRVPKDILVGSDRSITVNVIFNFLVNARKFTPGTKKRDEPVNVFASIMETEGQKHVEVSIEDGGEGPKDNVDPMSFFEKGISYNPGDRDVRGSGLGLYFAKLMIKNSMHGDVCMPFRNGRDGATFVFRYPCVESPDIS